MPIFDFRCRDCGSVSEVLVRGSDGARPQCGSCGGDNLEKLMTASYMIKMDSGGDGGHTCCGRTERCDTPACSTGGSCHHDH